ncbi:helix-turn-helix domain-containing protein [Embleya sp. AB8]|uniref:helix-turn-helix domain-containing protein n=1 Tax=Embleya sp. AB8 TaxID=3156304 RepID=UPI003C706509
MAAIPTVRRRMLGLELRKLREGRDLTSEDASTRMGWHPTKMSRLEGGRSGVRPTELTRLLDVYGVDDHDVREGLADLAKNSKVRVWWTPYNDVLTQRYSNFIVFEAEAVSARSFQQSLIPGLLQTPDYARAVTRALEPALTAAEVNALVDVRIQRQSAAFNREDPLKLWCILDESALRRKVGGSATMRKQLNRLLEAAEQPHVTFQALTYSAGAHAGLLGSFVHLEFPVKGDLDLVYLEGPTSSLYLERDDDLTTYGHAFDLLRASASDVEQSRDLALEIVKDMT